MDETRMTSTDSIFVCYGGEDTIDAQLLSDNIEQVVKLISRSQTLTAPEIEYSLKIQAFRPGSFIIEFLLSEESSNLFTSIGGIVVLGSAVIKFIDLLVKIGGKKVIGSRRDPEKGRVSIQTENGEEHNTTDGAYSLFLDQHSQNYANNIFERLNEDNSREFFRMNNSETSTRIDRQAFKTLATQTSLENLKDEFMTTRFQYDVAIIKPTLSGSSRWTLYIDKRIDATIEDSEFQSRVHSGEIQFKNGDYLKADLRVERQLDEHGMPVPNSERYFVERVHFVFNPKDEMNESQMSLDDVLSNDIESK